MTLAKIKLICPSFFSEQDNKKDKRRGVLNRKQGTFLVIERQQSPMSSTIDVPVYWFNPIINELDYVGSRNNFETAKDIIKADFRSDDLWITSPLFVARANANRVIEVTMDDEIRNMLTELAATLIQIGSIRTLVQKQYCKDMADKIETLQVKSGHMKDDILPVLKWISTLLRQ